MKRPHSLCRYPKCDCITSGNTCLVADMEDHYNAIEDQKATEPYCSLCGLPESDLGSCTRSECAEGLAYMIDPKAAQERRE